MNKLQQLYPTRNYNRTIKLPSQDLASDETDLYPNALRKLILHIRDIVQTAVQETERNIELEQESVKGFLEVETQKRKNKDLVIKAISEDVGIKMIESNVIKLCGSLGIDLTTDMTGDSTKAHFRSRKKSR